MSDPQRPGQLPIAVVGVSALMPGSQDVAGFWRTVVRGEDQIRDVPPTHWLIEDYYDPDPSAKDKTYARRGAFLDPVQFDPLAYGIPPKTLEATDTTQLLSLMVADRLIKDATRGGHADIDRDRVGVILGTAPLDLLATMSNRLQRPVWLKALRESGIEESVAQGICDRIADHYVPWQEATFPGLLSNVVAGRIANKFDLHGANYTTDAACASSLAAVSAAVAELSLGRADMMVTGGVDTLNDIVMYMCFSKTPALSPSGDCRPFSDQADGTMLGEGLVMFALKRLADAERDGDQIYAVLRGIGSSSDGDGTAIYAPAPQGQSRALRRAYESAGYGPETVELLEAHGTGTKAGDTAEITALRAVFAEAADLGRPWVALGSLKSQFGHTKSAAGAAGLLKTVLALHHKILPPTIKVDQPNPDLAAAPGPLYVNTQARPWIRDGAHPRRAAVSSFGFGGSNFHLTVEEYLPADGRAAISPGLSRIAATELVLLSAGSPGELADVCRSPVTGSSLAGVARRSQLDFRTTDPARLAIVASDMEDLNRKLGEAAKLIEATPEQPFTTPSGICYGTKTAAGKVAFLFPGQGSQYVGMGADIAMQLPVARAAWDAAAGVTGVTGVTVGDRPLHEVVFPIPVFSDAERAAQESLLTRTEWAQPALAVQSLALLGVLDELGVKADCVGGHSFGELVALHAAGVFDAESLLRLARRRGEVMSEAAASTPGAMLAITASFEDVERRLASSGIGDVWLANHNAPDQTVVSGGTAAIARFEDRLSADGLKVRRLNAAAAFHSPVVAAASEPLRRFVGELAVGMPAMPVYGNSDARTYPADPDEVRRRIADHLAAQVRFVEQVTAMYDDGVRVFVEVGAGSALTAMVGDILDDRDHLAVSLDRKGRDGITSLHDALGRLAVAGITLDFASLWTHYGEAEDAAEPGRARMAVTLSGTNYNKPYPPLGGASQLPPPVTAARPVSVAAESPAPAPALAPAPAPVNGDDEWMRTFQEVQRHTAEAHAAYQRLSTESHLAYLRTVETMLGGGSAQSLESMLPPVESYPAPADLLTAAPSGTEVTAEQVPAPALSPTVAESTSVAASADVSGVDPGVGPGVGDVSGALLSAVADATGYPVSMLDLGMSLDGDLGVDSIKRVQILSALGEVVPGLPELDAAELGRLRTLGDIVDRLGVAVGGTSEPRQAASEGDTDGTTEDPAVSVVRGVVRAVAAPGSGLTLGGLGTGPVVVTEDGTGVAERVAAELSARGFSATVSAGIPADARGVVFLGGLREVSSVDDAVAVNREAFGIARAVASRFEDGPGVFVTVQDTGGDFGLAGRQPDRAWLGGVAALTRTAGKEWPNVSVKAIDCERGERDSAAIADAIVNELLTGGATLEVGLRADGTRLTLQTVREPVGTGPRPTIGPDSVIVATGGGRGVTAETLLELARAHQPRILLIGRSELVDEDPVLRGVSEERDLKRVLAEQFQRRTGQRPAAAEIGTAVAGVLAAREIRATLEALIEAGSPARYAALDVRDVDAVREELAQVRREWGPVTGIVHGAGVLADKPIAEKSDEQFARVFDTKVAGLRSLLSATADDPLDLLCVFSSVAARFGNVGQCDYAMANEVLNQVICAERVARPGTTVRAIAWGPWQGGMVDTSLAEYFRGHGVSLIPLAAGAEAFVAELHDPSSEAEVVIAAGGVDDPMAGGVAARTTSAQLWVSSHSHPYLADHEIAGTPVMPMALVLDWLTAAVREQFPWVPAVVLRDVKVLRKIALADFEGARHRFAVRTIRHEPSTLRLELLGDQDTLHYQATADLAGAAAEPRSESVPAGSPLSNGIYDGDVLFHGPRFHVLRSVEHLSGEGAVATVTGVDERGWSGRWSTDPAALDGGLQLALLWARTAIGGATLPMAVDEVILNESGPLTAPVRCHVRPVRTTGHGASCDIEFTDGDGAVWAVLRGVSLVLRPQ